MIMMMVLCCVILRLVHGVKLLLTRLTLTLLYITLIITSHLHSSAPSLNFLKDT